jgi:hypothetical protein
MKRQHAIFAGVIALAVAWGALVAPTAQAVTIAGWDFNNSSALTAPSVGTGTLTATGVYLPLYSLPNGGTTGLAGDNALAVYNVFNLTNGSLTFQISTHGYDQIGFSFAAMGTAGGFNKDAISFYVNSGSGFQKVITPDQQFIIQSTYPVPPFTPNLTGLGLENKDGVQFKMTFDGAATYNDGGPAIGYMALDNVVFSGHVIGNPEPVTGTLALAGLGALGLALLRRRAA